MARHYKSHKRPCYAVYDIEDNLCMVGTLDECSAYTGITEASILCSISRNKKQQKKRRSYKKRKDNMVYSFMKVEESEEV